MPLRPIFPRAIRRFLRVRRDPDLNGFLSSFADAHVAPSSLPLAFPCLSPGHLFFLRRVAPGKAPCASSTSSKWSELRPDASKEREGTSAGASPSAVSSPSVRSGVRGRRLLRRTPRLAQVPANCRPAGKRGAPRAHLARGFPVALLIDCQNCSLSLL